MTTKQPELNNVKKRLLPIPQSALKFLEPEPNLKDFELIKDLGRGSFGQAFLACHKKTKVQYAIKAIDKRNKIIIEENPSFSPELEVMYKIHHPNLVKLFGHFEDNSYCYFIMEYISKGNVDNLLNLNKNKKLDTKVVASIIKDVISATYFLHHMNPPIIHKDIKPENVLINLLNDGIVAKLTDYGWSKYIKEDTLRKALRPIPIYLAPEIIIGKEYDEKVDIWCIGVLLFELITGSVPFKREDLHNLRHNIWHLKIKWPKEMDKDAKDLISKILKLVPNERITLEEMLEHPFITKYIPDAKKSLMLPDTNIIYKTFIVSKDDPKTWDPIKKNSNMLGPLDKQKNKVPQDKFVPLQEKYERVKIDFDKMKLGNNISKNKMEEMKELKEKIKAKKKKMEELMKIEKQPEIEDKDLKIKSNDLENENNYLRNQVLAFEQKIKEQQIQSIEKKLNEFRNSLAGYEDDFGNAFEDLKKHLEKETIQNFNVIIRNKDEEFEKYKREEKARREKEKQKYISLINRFDKTLSWVEGENEELKRKIKELEAKLPKK